MIKEIVSALESATKLKVYPFWTDELKECIVYEWTPLSDDGSKQTARLMVRIKTKLMADAEEYAIEVKNALIAIGDGSQVEGLTACEHNGGGMLKNEDTGFIDYIMYFDLVYRSDI
jgi:hypothetical protein